MERKDFSDLEINIENNKEISFEHEQYIAGAPPFLRGIYTTMYFQKPIETQLLVNFSSVEKSNTFIKEHILKGYKSFVLDINIGASSKIISGISISSVEIMKGLLNEIQLKDLSITLTTNNSILTVLGLFIAATNQLEIEQDKLNLSVILNSKNLIIDSDYNQNTVETIVAYAIKYLPKFNTISFSAPITYTEKSTDTDFALFLAAAYENLSYCISKGLKIDSIASKISFDYNSGKNHFFEISKMRAYRMLWAKMILQFNPKQHQSLALQLHSNTNFSDFNKVISAYFGGAQSVISTNIISEFILKETYISKTIDPWAGSTSVEKLTEKILNNTWTHFKEIQDKGGFLSVLNKDVSVKKDFKQHNFKNNLLEIIIKNIENNVLIEQLFKIINT